MKDHQYMCQALTQYVHHIQGKELPYSLPYLCIWKPDAKNKQSCFPTAYS